MAILVILLELYKIPDFQKTYITKVSHFLYKMLIRLPAECCPSRWTTISGVSRMKFRLIFPESYNRTASKFLKKHPELIDIYAKVLRLLEANPYHP